MLRFQYKMEKPNFENSQNPLSYLESLSEKEKEEYLELKHLQLKQFRQAKAEGQILTLNEAIIEQANQLQQKYPDFVEYLYYHVLIGSTPPGALAKIDFPNGDSVESFIRGSIYSQ